MYFVYAVLAVMFVSLAAAIYLGHLIEKTVFHYPLLVNTTRHVPGRSDREIIENLLRQQDDEQIELGL